MKTSLTGLAMISLASLIGCNESTPGGPGTTDVDVRKPIFGPAAGTFTLSAPVLATAIRPGEQAEATLGIERGENFEEDVVITFGGVPAGVTFEPASPVIGRSESEVKILVKAEEEATPGEYPIQVTGNPTVGSDALVDFQLSILTNDRFSLSVPLLSISLKQGETKTVSIGINRDTSFNEEVALAFGDLPTGVTIEPEAPVLGKDDSEVPITLTCADDASLGSFTFQVTGQPATGAAVTREVELSVVED